MSLRTDLALLDMRFFRIKIYPVWILTFGILCVSAQSQTPTPTPDASPSATPEVGKAYEAETIARPSTPARQYPSPVRFSDITAESGIAFRHFASQTEFKYLPETMGAGVALIDYNGDGLLDIFLTNGAPLGEKLGKNGLPVKTDKDHWDRLFRQEKEGGFTDVTEKLGVAGSGYSFGTAVGDYDRDGWPDLLVTRLGGATLYRNAEGKAFEDVTSKVGLEVSGWPTSAGFFDYDRDGLLDILVARYVVWDFGSGKIFCGDTRPGYRAYCHPDNFNPSTSQLFRQLPGGKFSDVSAPSGFSGSKGKALGVAFADFDGDGWTDVIIANDNAEQQLFRNLRNGTFEELALTAGVAFDERGKRFAGMGVDAADYDGDGMPDVVITALSNETYPLYRNIGDWGFDYVTQTSGVAEITILGAGWGIKFVDVDNDGLRDIVVAQGHVLDTIEKTTSFLKYKQSPLMMLNDGRKFRNISVDAGPAFSKDLAARGLAAGDLDNDGDVDIVIAQTNGEPLILRNEGTQNDWIGISLAGTGSASGGEGARVVVTDGKGARQVFDVSASGSYLSSNDPRIIAGLGPGGKASKVTVYWPSGKVSDLTDPETGRYHRVAEPSDKSN